MMDECTSFLSKLLSRDSLGLLLVDWQSEGSDAVASSRSLTVGLSE